jgi:predicted RNA-binding Zn-ribbon protein involved in translation (DUF1610 family)
MKDEILDAEVGDIFPILCTTTGVYYESVIVQVTCPACGEYFKGIKRDAGGFIAGHQAYHEFTNAQDMLIHTMGGV